MELALLVLLGAGLFAGGLFTHKLFPAYAAEKGKNLATKEDIAEITAKVEEVKSVFATELQRFHHDYGLFAAKRNDVYADLYGRLERVRGAFGAIFGVTIATDWSQAMLEDIAEYVEDQSTFMTPGERAEIRKLIAANALDAARNRCLELWNELRRREADREFIDLKNHLVLNALYTSEPVGALLWDCVKLAGNLSADLMMPAGHRRKPMEGYTHCHKLDGMAELIRDLMRREMGAPRISDAPVLEAIKAPASPAGGDG